MPGGIALAQAFLPSDNQVWAFEGFCSNSPHAMFSTKPKTMHSAT